MTTSTNIILRRGILTAFALVFSLLTAGCLTSFHALQRTPGITIRTENSAKVSITKAWLERHEGRPVIIAGTVVRAGEGDTTSARLSVTVLDVNGNELMATEALLTPRELPAARRPVRSGGSFRQELGQLPAGAVEIRVRVLD